MNEMNLEKDDKQTVAQKEQTNLLKYLNSVSPPA